MAVGRSLDLQPSKRLNLLGLSYLSDLASSYPPRPPLDFCAVPARHRTQVRSSFARSLVARSLVTRSLVARSLVARRSSIFDRRASIIELRSSSFDRRASIVELRSPITRSPIARSRHCDIAISDPRRGSEIAISRCRAISPCSSLLSPLSSLLSPDLRDRRSRELSKFSFLIRINRIKQTKSERSRSSRRRSSHRRSSRRRCTTAPRRAALRAPRAPLRDAPGTPRGALGTPRYSALTRRTAAAGCRACRAFAVVALGALCVGGCLRQPTSGIKMRNGEPRA